MTDRRDGGWDRDQWQKLGRLEGAVEDQERRLGQMETRNWYMMMSVITTLCGFILQAAFYLMKGLGK